jgi:arylsulfatase B
MRHLLTAVIAALTLAGVSASAEQRPNVIFIVVDDLGYGELGCYGGKGIPTPHIDALAAGGVRFTNGYVTAPFCAASRAALMTGRFQTRFGFEFNPIGAKNAAPGIGLPVAEKTVADRLRDSGYATGLVGKWHLGGTAEFHPQRRGFDEFFGFLHEGHFYVPPPWQGVTTWLRRKTLPDGGQGRWTSPDGRIVWSTHLGSNEPEYDTDNPLLRSSQPVDEQANLTDAFTREACDFIARHRAQPFFLYLAYNAVHSPMQATDAYLKKFAHIEDIQRRIFAAMLAHLDDSVGKVLAQPLDSGIE